jgi:hypothetical protein
MASHTSITYIGDDSPGFWEVYLWLIEYAVSQARTNENAKETIHEERFEQLHAHILTLVEVLHYHVARKQTYYPAKGVITYFESQEREWPGCRVPHKVAGYCSSHNPKR